MRTKSQKYKFLAIMELISGFVLILVSLILYQFREKISGLQDDSTMIIVIFAIGLFSLLISLVWSILSKKAREKEASPIEY